MNVNIRPRWNMTGCIVFILGRPGSNYAFDKWSGYDVVEPVV